MKKALLFIAGIALLQSCKEIGPDIDFGTTVSEDTAYTADVEAVQTKKVLAEEFTGVSCPPCPNGHETMKAIGQNLNGNLVVVAYHIFNYPQADPVSKEGKQVSKYDFRTEDATDVSNSIYQGLTGMPKAGMDRVAVVGTDLQLDRGQWSNAAENRSKVPTPVNIHIESSFDAGTREATVKVTLAYTSDVEKKQNLTVAITEDGIIDAQKKEDSIIHEYEHEHVLRDIITPIVGTQIPEKVNPKVAGKVYERIFKVAIKEEWNADNCHVVAFVTNNEADDHEVLQAEDATLTGK